MKSKVSETILMRSLFGWPVAPGKEYINRGTLYELKKIKVNGNICFAAITAVCNNSVSELQHDKNQVEDGRVDCT